MSEAPPRRPGAAAEPSAGRDGALDPDRTSTGPVPRVVLHTRERCHLCDVARAAVQQACASAGAAWEEVDVDAPAARRDGLHERFTDLVPVVTVDGRHHSHFRVDADVLERALREGPRTGAGDGRRRAGTAGG